MEDRMNYVSTRPSLYIMKHVLHRDEFKKESTA